jgi:hypothetical protein
MRPIGDAKYPDLVILELDVVVFGVNLRGVLCTGSGTCQQPGATENRQADGKSKHVNSASVVLARKI